MIALLKQSGHGGIGRRATLRWLWENSREGSSPFGRTKHFLIEMVGTGGRNKAFFMPNGDAIELFFIFLMVERGG